MRQERDALGVRQLPDGALYGINTLRAMENFDLHAQPVRMELIRAIVLIKLAAAESRLQCGGGREEVWRAIAAACRRVLAGEACESFCTQALQGGAGTSMHMNANEVLANLALRELGAAPGDYARVHPLDDVNRGQSTNDVVPTALRIAAIGRLRTLSEACAALQTALQEKEQRWRDVPKLGRTELQDAVPITLGEELGAWAQAIARDRWRLYKVEERLRQVNFGGAAVGLPGSGDRKWRHIAMEILRRETGFGLSEAEYPMDITQNCDVFVEVSGLLKALAANLMKISGDLRLMGSGPHGGLGELRLKPLQQGSTIMPGKVNPVIPEMVMQCAMRVYAGDAAISMAAARGEFELNAFLPLIADSLLESLQLLEEAVRLLRVKCIEPLEADEARCRALLQASSAFAAAYAPVLGYDRVAALVRGLSPEEMEKKLKEEAEACPKNRN